MWATAASSPPSPAVDDVPRAWLSVLFTPHPPTSPAASFSTATAARRHYATALQPPRYPLRSPRVRLASSTSHPLPGEPVAPTVAPALSPLSPASSGVVASPPLAYQDMGRNKPKLYYYPPIPSPTSALDSSPSASSGSPSLIAVEEPRSDQQLVVDHFFSTALARRFASPFAGLLQHMLPTNYPQSVSTSYSPYSKWSFLQGISSTASGVLSMQCLLYAVGLGQPLSVPAAAAIQWVLKDGLGQFGGMVFASYVSSSFDSDAKRWRMWAAILMDFSVMVEILTPLFPNLFLLMASGANIAKNIAWLSSSAARAAIHRSFCREENLADVTAKANSQAIGASLVGTALGIAVSYAVGTNPLSLLAVFAGFSAVHLSSTYVSLCGVPLNTVNDQRGERVMAEYVRQGTVPTTEGVRDQENFLSRYRSPLARTTGLNMEARLTDLLEEFAAMAPPPSTPLPPTSSNPGPAPSSVPSAPLDVLLEFYDDQPYILTIRPTFNASSSFPRYMISLAFLSTATSSDVLTAHLLSVHYRTAIANLLSSSPAPPTLADLVGLLRYSVRWVREHRATFLQLLARSGWNVEHLFVEVDRQRRIHVLQGRGARRKEGEERLLAGAPLPKES